MGEAPPEAAPSRVTVKTRLHRSLTQAGKGMRRPRAVRSEEHGGGGEVARHVSDFQWDGERGGGRAEAAGLGGDLRRPVHDPRSNG